ncbi:ParB N-terminal domain-containing protein [Actinoplanes sp. NPDC049548]|uniref:ParB/RepB/Spo0J family partition protein n=1 Tax=Actinoplanes sp. NPDC049548 TaxID=3155152 RepID=UPI00344AB95B
MAGRTVVAAQPGDQEVRWLPISALLPADSPRQGGEDIEHIRMLAGIGEPLPPIIVHRATMRVIDGMHRLGAAILRGDELIEVRLFDGTDKEAFLLAVQSNIAHGLPLSLADRIRAAERIVTSHPTWSDRAIAAVAGLGARTVGTIRGRLQVDMDPGVGRARTGRDGRVRPLDNAEGRLRASAIIQERPNASLREVAREAGISPSTVRDVRQRVAQGQDPVPQKWRRGHGPKPADPRHGGLLDRPALAEMLQGLQSDPSLRFTEQGRILLRWIYARAIRQDERVDVVEKVPPHCSYIMVNVARACADEWLQLANALERRTVAD